MSTSSKGIVIIIITNNNQAVLPSMKQIQREQELCLYTTVFSESRTVSGTQQTTGTQYTLHEWGNNTGAPTTHQALRTYGKSKADLISFFIKHLPTCRKQRTGCYEIPKMSKKWSLPMSGHGHTEMDSTRLSQLTTASSLFPLTTPGIYGQKSKWKHTYYMPKC